MRLDYLKKKKAFSKDNPKEGGLGHSITGKELELPIGDYDAEIFPSAKANWLFGKWELLVSIDFEEIANNPDRDKFEAEYLFK